MGYETHRGTEGWAGFCPEHQQPMPCTDCATRRVNPAGTGAGGLAGVLMAHATATEHLAQSVDKLAQAIAALRSHDLPEAKFVR